MKAKPTPKQIPSDVSPQICQSQQTQLGNGVTAKNTLRGYPRIVVCLVMLGVGSVTLVTPVLY